MHSSAFGTRVQGHFRTEYEVRSRPAYPANCDVRGEGASLETRAGYAGARNGVNFRSALAAKTKSLSVRPLILCDQISILHFPQAR